MATEDSFTYRLAPASYYLWVKALALFGPALYGLIAFFVRFMIPYWAKPVSPESWNDPDFVMAWWSVTLVSILMSISVLAVCGWMFWREVKLARNFRAIVQSNGLQITDRNGRITQYPWESVEAIMFRREDTPMRVSTSGGRIGIPFGLERRDDFVLQVSARARLTVDSKDWLGRTVRRRN